MSNELATARNHVDELFDNLKFSSATMFDESDPMAYFMGKRPESSEEYMVMYNASNNADEKLGDHINEEINITNVFIQNTEVADRDTGELKLLPRTVLIDAEGNSFGCSSTGVFSSIKKLFMIFGPCASWQNPITVKVKQVKVARGNMLTLEMVNSNGNHGIF